jgi:5-methyltetrahydrofolate--homocysteine methyltransferase
VAGAIGPTTKAITVTGGVSFPELKRQFRERVAALVEGGVDLPRTPGRTVRLPVS